MNFLQVVRRLSPTLRRIGSVPATVTLSRFDCRAASRGQTSLSEEPGGNVAVYLRPAAARSAPGEPHQPELIIEFVELSIHPTVGECHLDGFRFARRRLTGALLRELDPHAGGTGSLLSELRVPRSLDRGGENGQALVSDHPCCFSTPPRRLMGRQPRVLTTSRQAGRGIWRTRFGPSLRRLSQPELFVCHGGGHLPNGFTGKAKLTKRRPLAARDHQ